MTADIPWWGVPVVAGSFALIGVLISQLSTFRLERLKAKRDGQKHWRVEKRKIYSQYLLATNKSEQLAVSSRAHQKPVAPEFREQVLGGASAMVEAKSEVDFLASKPVAKAAENLHWAIRDLGNVSFSESSTKEESETKRIEMRNLRDEFIRQARIELGIEEARGD